MAYVPFYFVVIDPRQPISSSYPDGDITNVLEYHPEVGSYIIQMLKENPSLSFEDEAFGLVATEGQLANERYYAVIRMNMPEEANIPMYRLAYLDGAADDKLVHEVVRELASRTLFNSDPGLGMFLPATAIGKYHILANEAVILKLKDDPHRYFDVLLGGLEQLDITDKDLQVSPDALSGPTTV